MATLAASTAAKFYSKLDEPTKSRLIDIGTIVGNAGMSALKLPIYLLSAAINFFILAFIFILTLRAKMKALYDAGDRAYSNYTSSAFIKGLGWALLAVGVIFVVDIITGGFATIVMFVVYPLAGLGTLLLYLISPSFMNDITVTKDGENRGAISGYRLWATAFWTIFIFGMFAALGLGILANYIGSKLGKSLMDIAAKTFSMV